MSASNSFRGNLYTLWYEKVGFPPQGTIFQPGELAPTLAPSSFSPRFLKGHKKPKKCKL